VGAVIKIRPRLFADALMPISHREKYHASRLIYMYVNGNANKMLIIMAASDHLGGRLLSELPATSCIPIY
jgi:hypothetical protein